MNASDITIAIAIAEFFFLVVATLGGYMVLRSSIAKTNVEMQNHVRNALKDENELLQGRIERLEKDVLEAKAESMRVSDLMSLLIETLEKRGIIVEIDGDMVIVKDTSGSSVTVRQKKPPATRKETP